jgi:hypothetical protein
MSSVLSLTQSESSAGLWATEPSVDPKSLARPRPLPDHVLHRCCSHRGLAVLRRRGQRDDRELVPAAWLVGTAGRTRYTDRSRYDRAGRAHHPFCRSGAAQSDVARSRRGAAKRRPACRRARRRPGADDPQLYQAAGGRAGHPSQDLSASAAAGRIPGAEARAAADTLMARSGRRGRPSRTPRIAPQVPVRSP